MDVDGTKFSGKTEVQVKDKMHPQRTKRPPVNAYSECGLDDERGTGSGNRSLYTLEAMRGALLQLLAQEMETSFGRLQAQVSSEPRGESTSETELEALVSDAVQRSRETSASDRTQD